MTTSFLPVATAGVTPTNETPVDGTTSSSSPFSDDIRDLFKQHLDHLKASAISVEVIHKRGYVSALGRKHLAELRFTQAQQRIPGILVPSWTVNKQQITPESRLGFTRVMLSWGCPLKGFLNYGGLKVRQLFTWVETRTALTWRGYLPILMLPVITSRQWGNGYPRGVTHKGVRQC
jgi:hypothetical protein